MATAGLLLIHAPPEVGDKVVVFPIQIVFDPVIDVVGLEITLMLAVGSDIQEEFVSKNVKLAEPRLTPVTIPELDTVATDGLLLVHVPPLVGDNVVMLPIQILPGPVMETDGLL